MKAFRYIWIIGAMLVASCGLFDDTVKVKDPITISSPVPTQKITKVGLDETQSGYVDAGNTMAFKFLQQMYSDENVICSPLSLQYALAMTANGASGETLREISDFLGYGDSGIDDLNEYCRILLEQLPAVDLDVTLKVVDALLVNETCPLSPSFKETVQNNYYAAVGNMDFNDPKQIAARINDWAKRSTGGFIDNVMNESEISPDALAYIMNALYFKAAWADSYFNEHYTKSGTFYLSDGTTCKTDMMDTRGRFRYAEMDGFKVLSLPFAGGKFCLYILLPDENDLDGLVDKLPEIKWTELGKNFKNDADVIVKIPKFTVECKYDLSEQLQALGVVRPFMDGVAEFDRMFDNANSGVHISKVIQKSKISVTEDGAEAGSVTIVEMAPTAAEPSEGEEPKIVNFIANRPFVYLIGERTSGTILFEGTFVRP